MKISTNKLLFWWILILNSSVFAAEEVPNIAWFAVIILIVLAFVFVFLFEKKMKTKKEQLKRMASKGDGKALYDLGIFTYNSGAHIEGMKYLIKAAEQKYTPGLNKARSLASHTDDKSPIIDFCKEKETHIFKAKSMTKLLFTTK